MGEEGWGDEGQRTEDAEADEVELNNFPGTESQEGVRKVRMEGGPQ